jgi:uncharacterized Zn-finger protein
MVSFHPCPIFNVTGFTLVSPGWHRQQSMSSQIFGIHICSLAENLPAGFRFDRDSINRPHRQIGGDPPQPPAKFAFDLRRNSPVIDVGQNREFRLKPAARETLNWNTTRTDD